MIKRLMVLVAAMAMLGAIGCSKDCRVCFDDGTGGNECITIEDMKKSECEDCGEKVAAKVVEKMLSEMDLSKTTFDEDLFGDEEMDLEMKCSVK